MADAATAPFETIPTADGARIVCKRKPAAGPPIVFVHGIAVNADVWDIPDIRRPGLHFRSLSTLLHERGHDIWLVNLRGSGAPHMLSQPAEGQRDWVVDHFILFDLPAVLEHVERVSRQRPFVISNSLGAMTTAAYLQGAALVGYGVDQAVIADEAAARRRNEGVAGCVLIEFPAALRWPQAAYDAGGALNWRELLRGFGGGPDSNLAFELFSRAGWLQAVLDAAGSLRLDWLRPRHGTGAEPEAPREGWGQTALELALRTYSQRFQGALQFRPEVFTHGLLHAVDHLKAGVLRQLSKSVRAGAFLSELGSREHAYSEHYDQITAPLLVVAGGRDRIANAQVTREVFFERAASTDKTFEMFETIAHGEFAYAPAAYEQVYPRIVEWVGQRSR